MDELSPKREIKQGRRAGNPFQAGSQRSGGSDSNTSVQGTSPRPARRQGGWAEDASKKKGEFDEDDDDGKGGRSDNDDDERLKHDATVLLDNDVDDIPVIPDLEEVQDDDMALQVAAPPSVQVTRVATYKELDHDFEKHAGLLTLDGDIDLKLLGSVLSPEAEVIEDDKVWDWDRIFTEVASDLRTEWEKAKVISDNKD
ncbi:intraflagellar transport protein 43 homolog isoform X1 [Hydractinia symbiolongicarpus]|uniref:intraflagellar transport protein 43 homolog isoform X1 n=1 Tax=Hydractinia symbiolongicarpus TaxID=13093 RepID=UPI00254EF03F|nr:intraflagellar transport protein 43 homolog isoform X1 [Hydractinia symbiolongicarpus]